MHNGCSEQTMHYTTQLKKCIHRLNTAKGLSARERKEWKLRKERKSVEEVAAEILASISLPSPSISLVRMLNLLFDAIVCE